jgi:hypothetical protein
MGAAGAALALGITARSTAFHTYQRWRAKKSGNTRHVYALYEPRPSASCGSGASSVA